jgi:hypothetical protein
VPAGVSRLTIDSCDTDQLVHRLWPSDLVAQR